jgi:CBS domain-containing protein
MSVAQLCQRSVDTISADESVFAAAERMHQRTVGALVVVDAARRPIGIVTDRDLAVRALAACKGPHTTSVSEVMTRPVVTADEGASLSTALGMMREGPFRRLPVVGPQGQLAGMITLHDVLAALIDQFSRVAEVLERQTPVAAASNP